MRVFVMHDSAMRMANVPDDCHPNGITVGNGCPIDAHRENGFSVSRIDLEKWEFTCSNETGASLCIERPLPPVFMMGSPLGIVVKRRGEMNVIVPFGDMVAITSETPLNSDGVEVP